MINIKKVKPMFNRILTTADKYEDVIVHGIIDGSKSNTIKEFQRVIAVGTTVNSIKVGDLVLINPKRYAVKKHQEGSLKDGVITDNPVIGYNFDTVEVDGKDCLALYDNDISYIIEEYDDVPDSNIIVDTKPDIIS